MRRVNGRFVTTARLTAEGWQVTYDISFYRILGRFVIFDLKLEFPHEP